MYHRKLKSWNDDKNNLYSLKPEQFDSINQMLKDADNEILQLRQELKNTGILLHQYRVSHEKMAEEIQQLKKKMGLVFLIGASCVLFALIIAL